MSRSIKSTADVACDSSKRDFIKKAAYAAPAILTLQAHSALAKAGSVKDPKDKKRKKSRP
jgi:hypothetical protein